MTHHHDEADPTCERCQQLLAALSDQHLAELRDLLVLLQASGTDVAPGTVEMVEAALAARQPAA